MLLQLHRRRNYSADFAINGGRERGGGGGRWSIQSFRAKRGNERMNEGSGGRRDQNSQVGGLRAESEEGRAIMGGFRARAATTD